MTGVPYARYKGHQSACKKHSKIDTREAGGEAGEAGAWVARSVVTGPPCGLGATRAPRGFRERPAAGAVPRGSQLARLGRSRAQLTRRPSRQT